MAGIGSEGVVSFADFYRQQSPSTRYGRIAAAFRHSQEETPGTVPQQRRRHLFAGLGNDEVPVGDVDYDDDPTVGRLTQAGVPLRLRNAADHGDTPFPLWPSSSACAPSSSSCSSSWRGAPVGANSGGFPPLATALFPSAAACADATDATAARGQSTPPRQRSQDQSNGIDGSAAPQKLHSSERRVSPSLRVLACDLRQMNLGATTVKKQLFVPDGQTGAPRRRRGRGFVGERRGRSEDVIAAEDEAVDDDDEAVIGSIPFTEERRLVKARRREFVVNSDRAAYAGCASSMAAAFTM